VDTIPQKELRNDVSAVLRRVEAGETLVITVAGRPVAELSPTGRRRWVKGSELVRIWSGPTPRGLEDELTQLDAGLTDPFDQ
jgi:prevent-host-death family protein